jgi:large subunit ribosomal protein L22
MEIKAKLNNLKISPRKVRLVVDVVRGLESNKALNQLKHLNKKAAKPVEKLLHSCIANAVNNYDLDKNNLLVKTISVCEGATLHRWMPKAHGRATPIRKRTSHIEIVLSEIKDSGKKEAKKQKVEKPIKISDLGKEIKEPKIIEKKKAVKKQGVNLESIETEKGKEIVDPRGEGHGKHTQIEGGSKGFVNKIFRRKSG